MMNTFVSHPLALPQGSHAIRGKIGEKHNLSADHSSMPERQARPRTRPTRWVQQPGSAAPRWDMPRKAARRKLEFQFLGVLTRAPSIKTQYQLDWQKARVYEQAVCTWNEVVSCWISSPKRRTTRHLQGAKSHLAPDVWYLKP